MKILVIAPSWVGDMVMAQSLFITLKQQYPDCQIDVIAPPWTSALTQHMPEVSQAFIMPVTRGKLGLIERIKLGKSLRSQQYDQAILLPNTWKSALTPFFASISKRTGYVGECRFGLLNDIRKLDKQVLTKTVQRFVALAYPKSNTVPPCPTPVFSVNTEQQQQLKIEHALTGRVLALCPGAEYGVAKQWSADYYAKVANQKLADGWQVCLLGSPKDSVISDSINQLTDNRCLNFSGKTSINEAVILLSLADVVVSNDSGLMHVASALDKKLIAIYGSSDPHFTPPLNQQAKILYLDLDCSPCFKRVCPLGHTRCLTEITPEQVLAVF